MVIKINITKEKKKVNTLLSAENGHSSEHSFSCDEEFFPLCVLVSMAELNAGEGGTTAGVVDDFL